MGGYEQLYEMRERPCIRQDNEGTPSESVCALSTADVGVLQAGRVLRDPTTS